MPDDPPPPAADDYKLAPEPALPEGSWTSGWPVSARHSIDGWRVQIRWGRLLVATGLGLVVAWLGLVSAAFLFIKYERGFTGVRFADLLLAFEPTRWEDYEHARGDFFIVNADHELQAGNFLRSIFDLQIGVVKSPGNLKGREMLADFYVATLQPEKAKRTLLDGLEWHQDDSDYLKKLFDFLLRQQEDPVIMTIARRLLPPTAKLTGDKVADQRNQMIAFVDAEALDYRGNYDQAENLIQEWKLDAYRDGRLLAIRLEWERGYHALALSQLKEVGRVLGKDAEIYRLTVTYLRAMGREEEARALSVTQETTSEGAAYPRIDLLYAYHQDGDEEKVRAGAAAILHDFPHDSDALVELADFAANTGNPELAHQIYLHCKDDASAKLDWQDPALMYIEAEVVAKQYQTAIEDVRRLLAANPDWAQRFSAVFNGLQAIASYGLGDENAGQIYLANFVNQRTVRAENFVAVSNRLLAIGEQAPARVMLAQAVKNDRYNQAALTNLIKLDIANNNPMALTLELPRYLGMRMPAADVLQSAYDKLGSDLFLFNPDRSRLLDLVGTTLTAAKARDSSI